MTVITVSVCGRSEVDEEFRFVQHRFRRTVEELLLAQIRDKHPLKTEDARKSILQKKLVVRGRVCPPEPSPTVSGGGGQFD